MRPIYRIIAGLTVVSLIAASTMPAVKTQAASAQCTALAAKRQRTAQDMEPKIVTLNDIRIKNKFNIPQAGNVTQEKINLVRKKADDKRTDIYKKLEAKTKTPKQKTALSVYKKQVQDALVIHRAADDTARASFIAGIDTLFATQRADVDAGLNSLKAQYDKAFTNAATFCEKMGIEKATIQLKNDIELAEKNYNLIPNIAPADAAVSVKNLADIGQTARNAADKAFQVSLSTARTELKQAFGKDTKNIFEPSKEAPRS